MAPVIQYLVYCINAKKCLVNCAVNYGILLWKMLTLVGYMLTLVGYNLPTLTFSKAGCQHFASALLVGLHIGGGSQ